ncbi:uracil-DNA glycosylase [Olleya aquimaris]|uniref:Uracil-DNA glycosylase n=1 Tax=Olleya aquimaris TaxID=639310 RepID=A0A327RR15_9FLAO|nr:uracil-DNA glycosylase [Olleya aquimaris]RAJ16167.1 uracil-DNA glycosylase [Olleya aquimaris]
MNININNSWKTHLQAEIDTPYFKSLRQFVTSEYKQHQYFPPEHLIFNAFEKCPLDDLKVVIIGQDPYHNYDQANGLCFSVNDGVAHPPSLINIFKEIETDLGISYPSSGNLERWATQGVFLLNATLTVRAHEAGSHQKKGWETFTDSVIKTISEQKDNVVFLLWGGFAKKKAKLIDGTKHHILESGHPSPLSANRGYWFGNRHFSQTNKLLEDNGLKGVDW